MINSVTEEDMAEIEETAPEAAPETPADQETLDKATI